MKPRLWSLLGVFTALCGLQQVTTGRGIKKHSLPKQASKRQLVGNGVMIGRVFVRDTDPASEAALAQTKGNPGDKSSEFQTGNKGYRNSGCYKDTDSRAVPSMEGSDPDLTGFYKQRQEPISKCAAVARSRGYQLFAIQNGGMCLSGPKAQESYKIHGLARNCKDGKGGEWANDVYIFNDFPLRLHIFTGTEPEAGTDANVYITLSGSMGTSRRISLAPENANQNLFESGQNDVFNVHTIPLGTISGITIGHDDTGKKPADWFLRKVVVKDAANTMYKFDVNRWLSKNKDDSQIERELSLTATITPGSYKSIGCFKERTDVNKDRAIPSLEGRDDVLDGMGATAYRDREFPIEKCADAAKRRGYVMFAIQDGGLCATSKEIQNTYDIYGKGDDCKKNGTGSAFSSSVYTFSDEEPGFQDPGDQEAGTEEGSENTQSQPALPSDPAMQLAGQLSSPTNKEDSPEAGDTTLNKQKFTPTAATATSGDISETASSGNQGEPSRGSDQGEPSRGGGSNSQGISGGQEETRPDAENIKGDQTEIKNGQGPTSEQTNEPVASKGVDETAEKLPENNQEKTQQSTNPSTSDRSAEGKEPVTVTEKPNSERNEPNGNSPGLPHNPSQSSGVTKYPVITDTTPQESKSHPGREDNEILRPGTPDKLGEKTSIGEESPGEGKGLTGGNGSAREKESQGGEESRIVDRTPLIEPLQTKVHKIAPETRLPGEFNSPSSSGHNIIFKTKQNPISRPFSKLLDAQQRNEIKHLLKKPKK